MFAYPQSSAGGRAFLDQFDRMPAPTDDATKGHAVGDVWTYRGPDSRIFVCEQTTAGRAFWRARAANGALPLDMVTRGVTPTSGATVRGAYGTVKLRAAYSGPCLRARRAGDNAEADIGFTTRHVNGRTIQVLDETALQTHLAGAEGFVVTLYDQSGATNHATQSTATNQPRIGFNYVAGIPSVSMYESQLNTPAPRFLAVTTGAAIGIQRRACSAFFAGRNRSSFRDSAVFQVNQAGTPTQQLRLRLSMGISPAVPSMGVQGESGTILAPSGEMVAGWITRAAPSVTYHSQGRSVTRALTLSDFAMSGWAIGGDNDVAAATAEMDLVAAILWSGSLVDGEAQNVRDSLADLTGIALQQPDTRVVTSGDSITFGTGTIAARNRQYFEERLIGRRVEYVNVAVSGRELATELADAASLSSTVYDATIPRIIVLCANNGADILVNRTGAQLFADTVAYAQFWKGLGPNVRFIATTTTASTQPTGQQITEATNFRASLLAGNPAFDGVVDFVGEPILANGSDNTIYTDGTHPSAAGYSLMASLTARAISRLLPQ